MSNLKKILVITDSDRVISALKDFLVDKFQIVSSTSLNLECFVENQTLFEFIFVDYILLNNFKTQKQDDDYYKEKLSFIKNSFPEIRVFILADARKQDDAGSLLKLGFNNILQIPFTKEVLEHRLLVEEERVQLKEVSKAIVNDFLPSKSFFHTENSDFSHDLENLVQIAKSRTTILITGESGTGKSLLAKYIHQLSERSERHFVEVHCGAIPETLVESELFGHEKGSFTGAIKRKIGKFELANKSTIFLDEVGTITRPVQVRLLQVLQERFIQRVGGEADIPLDIRIIAATNNDLKSMVKEGDFREDLYFRLNVFQIEIPALRNRKEDIPFLCQKILEKLNALYEKEIKAVSHEALSIFHNYNWPGNVRELENILERAYVLERGKEISAINIPREMIPASRDVLSISPLDRRSIGLVEARREATASFEKKYLTELLIAHRGKVSIMAKEAQVSVRQLHKLMAKHAIKSTDFSIKLDQEEQEVHLDALP